MESDANYYYKMRTISKTCYTANITYLAIHAFYLVLFIVAKLNVMIWVDVGVIALYASFFLILKKK